MANSIVGAIELMPVVVITRVRKYHRTTILHKVRKILEILENDKIMQNIQNRETNVRKKTELQFSVMLYA